MIISSRRGGNVEHSEAIRLMKDYLRRPETVKNVPELKRHVAGCPVCADLLGDEVKALLGTPQSIVTEVKDFLSCEACSEWLPEYAEFQKDEAKERYPLVWRHLRACSSCREVYENLHEIAVKEERGEFGPIPKGLTFKETMEREEAETALHAEEVSVAAAVVKKRFESVTSKFLELIRSSPLHIKESLERIKPDIQLLFQQTFTYPPPSFAPVFGGRQPFVLSPFGKVRYPIHFKWEAYDGADQYTLSIRGTEWSLDTRETAIDLTPTELELAPNNEYAWELQIIKERSIIDRISGFFSLIAQDESKELEEIGARIKTMGTKEESLLLWGAILEKKELFIEAIDHYRDSYHLKPSPEVAYRIAYCYHQLELEDLRDEWNRKIC